MSSAEASERLYRLGGELHSRRKYDLEHMRVLARALGDPQESFRSVLIAGTNGKGSTAATLAAIVAAAGYRVGLYTSPHLMRVNERIQILSREKMSGGVSYAEIGDEAFSNVFEAVEAAAGSLVEGGKLPGEPSFFETLTAMGFLYFSQQRVDLAIVEVGMGGRLDATNIVNPLLSVITDISLDHTEWLGATVTEIAREKAGILRPGGIMVTLPQHPEANQALGEIAVSLGARGVNAAEFVPPRSADEPANRNRYSVEWGGKLLIVDSPLAGQHQQRNIALALASADRLRNKHGYNIDGPAVQRGVHETRWPGRLERYPRTADRAEILMDVGHNPAGAWALRMAISHLAEGTGPRTIVFSCLRDKPASELAQILFPLFDRVIVAAVASPRASTVEQLVNAAEGAGVAAEAAASGRSALELAIRETAVSGLIVVTGSVLLVGALKEYLAEAAVGKDAGVAQTV